MNNSEYIVELERLKKLLASDMKSGIFIKSGVFNYINNLIDDYKARSAIEDYTFMSNKVKATTDSLRSTKVKAEEYNFDSNWFTQNQKRYSEGDGSKYKKKTSLINSHPIQKWEWNDVLFGDVTNIINNVFYKADDEIVEIKNVQIIQQDIPTYFTIIAYVRIINGGTK
jgi:hypothetical protein